MVPLVGGGWGEGKTLVIGVSASTQADEAHVQELSYCSRLAKVAGFEKATMVEMYRRGVEQVAVRNAVCIDRWHETWQTSQTFQFQLEKQRRAQETQTCMEQAAALFLRFLLSLQVSESHPKEEAFSVSLPSTPPTSPVPKGAQRHKNVEDDDLFLPGEFTFRLSLQIKNLTSSLI